MTTQITQITNLITGQLPTRDDLAKLHSRAIEIFRSPYTSPEQLDWAISVYPEGIAEPVIQRPKPWEVQ